MQLFRVIILHHHHCAVSNNGPCQQLLRNNGFIAQQTSLGSLMFLYGSRSCRRSCPLAIGVGTMQRNGWRYPQSACQLCCCWSTQPVHPDVQTSQRFVYGSIRLLQSYHIGRVFFFYNVSSAPAATNTQNLSRIISSHTSHLSPAIHFLSYHHHASAMCVSTLAYSKVCRSVMDTRYGEQHLRERLGGGTVRSRAHRTLGQYVGKDPADEGER